MLWPKAKGVKNYSRLEAASRFRSKQRAKAAYTRRMGRPAAAAPADAAAANANLNALIGSMAGLSGIGRNTTQKNMMKARQEATLAKARQTARSRKNKNATMSETEKRTSRRLKKEAAEFIALEEKRKERVKAMNTNAARAEKAAEDAAKAQRKAQRLLQEAIAAQQAAAEAARKAQQARNNAEL